MVCPPLTATTVSGVSCTFLTLTRTRSEGGAAASAVELYELKEFGQEMRDMAAIIVDSARLAAEAMPLLRDVGRNGKRLHQQTERLVRMEGHAYDIHSAGLKKAFQQHRTGDPIDFVVQREIFKHLERFVYAFEDVANVIDGIVIVHR